jgi:ABC-type dipeptide/oligopeptide/nickel transport system permease component
MANYIIRRLLMLVPTLFGITFVSFLILQFVPGDPARFAAGQDADEETIAIVRTELGLDRSIPVQYGIFLKNVVKGNLGRSMVSRSEVIHEIWPHFLNTVRLAMASILIAFFFGILLGTLAAIYQNSWIDYLTMVVVLLGISTPTFWSGLVIILIFSVNLGWFPSGGAEGFHSIVLPALTLAAPSIAMAARMTRSSMLEVLRQDYIKTARAKGQKEWKVVSKHALKNALIPTVTIIGLQFGYLMGGAVLVETIFTWPGLGRLIVSSISGRDYPMVQGGVLLFAFSFVLVNLLIDVIYTYLDPRITYE